jgi:hypothetical protein
VSQDKAVAAAFGQFCSDGGQVGLAGLVLGSTFVETGVGAEVEMGVRVVVAMGVGVGV